MPITDNWDESQPDGAIANSADIDLFIKNLRRDIRERIELFLGISNLVAQTTAGATALKGEKIDLRNAVESKVWPGSTSFAVRNNADDANNLLVEDDGDVTIRKDLAVLGALNVTGLLTAAGGLSIPHAFLFTAAGPAGAGGNVAFASELHDTNGFHDNAVNNSRLTIPAGLAGTYLIVCGCFGLITDAGTFSVRIRKNNGDITEVPSENYDITVGTVSIQWPIFRLTIQTLAVSDFLEVLVAQTGGSTASNYYFGLIKIG